MRISKYLFTAVLTVFFCASIIAQEDIPVTVYQGASTTVTITAEEGASLYITQQPQAGNNLVLTSLVGQVHTYTYTPDPLFLGGDFFKIQEIKPPFSFKDYQVTVDVISSMVDTRDDFLKLNGDEVLVIDPTANDETSAGDLEISIAQVQKGNAVLNLDNNIVYTPSGDSRDYIVYSAVDSYGTSSKSTIYLTTDEVVDTDSEDEFQIPSGSYEYVILPNSDYTNNSGDLSFGDLEFVSDYVYKYSSFENVDGEENLSFLDSEGNEHSVSVGVVLVQTDEGFVKDDVFYTASNTQIQFDVKANDLNGQYVIADYSEELIHMGDGVFSFTPDAGFSGVLTFSYTADSGVEEEDGQITMIVNNYEPIVSDNINLTTPKNQPRIIEYEVPLGTEFFEIASFPMNGNLEIFNTDESVDVACDEGLQKVFALYTPDADFTGNDVFSLRYCASDNNTCDKVKLSIDVAETDVDECICVDDCVWPGDANGDGKVTITDVLSVGRYLGFAGAERETSPFGDIYEGTGNANWEESQANGKDISLADTDGNGIVTESDLDVIIDNYGSVNSIVSSDVLGVKNIPFGFINDTDVEVGDLKVLPIYAGSDDFPAVDIQGITFKTSLPPANVDESTIAVEFYENNYFVKNAPFVSVVHQTSPGQVYAAGIKTNSLGSTGSGVIGSLSFIVEEDAEGIKPQRRNSNATNTITIELTDIVVEDTKGFKYALPSTSITLRIKDSSDEKIAYLAYPNPANENVTLSSIAGEKMTRVEVYSVTGQMVVSEDSASFKNKTIDISNLDSGLYIMKVYGEKSTQTIKLIKG